MAITFLPTSELHCFNYHTKKDGAGQVHAVHMGTRSEMRKILYIKNLKGRNMLHEFCLRV
jgi:hypothetical protein